MPRLVGLNRQVWQPGTYQRGFNPPSDPPISIPLGLTQVTVLCERNAWPVLPGVVPDNQVLRFQIQLSMDGGLTWAQPRSIPHPGGEGRLTLFTNFGAGFVGGIRIGLDSNEITHATLGPMLLPEPTNPDRMARATMVVRVQLNTQLDFDVL